MVFCLLLWTDMEKPKHAFENLWKRREMRVFRYQMPEPVPQPEGYVEYWYAGAGEKSRAWDIRYMKKNFKSVHFVKLENIGHGGMASTRPREMADLLSNLIERDEKRK